MNRNYLLYCSVLFLSFFGFAQTPAKVFFLEKFEQKSLSHAYGSWFTGDDAPNGGKSTVTPTSKMLIKDSKNSNLKIEYSLDKGSFQWLPYVNITFQLNKSRIPLLWESTEGFVYRHKGAAHQFLVVTQSISDYAFYQISIPESKDWSTVTVKLDQLKQPTWGKKVDFSIHELTGLMWQKNGSNGETGFLELDDIGVVRKWGKEKSKPLKTNQAEESTKNSPNPLLDFYQKKYVLRENVSSIAPYPHGKTAAYSLTFDDGMASQFDHLLPILDSQQVKATFFIVPPSLSPTKENTNWLFGTEWMFQEIAKKGHEIGGHSMTHTDLTQLPLGDISTTGSLIYEIQQTRSSISALIPKWNPISFAYPFTNHNDQVRRVTLNHFKAARGSVSWQHNHPASLDLGNVTCHTLEFSRPYTREDENAKLENLKESIQKKVIGQGLWGVFLAHGVRPENELDNDESWHPINKQLVSHLIHFLKEKEENEGLWLATFGEVGEYLAKIKRTQLHFFEKSESEWIAVIQSTSAYQPTQPFTIRFSLPDSWKAISIKTPNFKYDLTKDEKNNTFTLVINPEELQNNSVWNIQKTK